VAGGNGTLARLSAQCGKVFLTGKQQMPYLAAFPLMRTTQANKMIISRDETGVSLSRDVGCRTTQAIEP
jgi:hypothetical protein